MDIEWTPTQCETFLDAIKRYKAKAFREVLTVLPDDRPFESADQFIPSEIEWWKVSTLHNNVALFFVRGPFNNYVTLGGWRVFSVFCDAI